MREITVSADMDQLRPVTDLLDGLLDELSCPEDIRVQLDVALDELFSNIVHYAYHQAEKGQITVRMESENDPPAVSITFIDGGVPFNPLEANTPESVSLPARNRKIGGLGLFVVKNTMDHIAYRYQEGKNILTIRKKF